jgi:hypothetical protein
MFGLSFNRPTPAELAKDEYHWTLSEEQRQERLAELRAHVRDLRTEQPQWETVYEPTPAAPLRAVPHQAEPLSVPWTNEPPTRPGLYWWRVRGLEPRLERAVRPHLCAVVDFGGRLSVRTRKGDSSAFISVAALARDWAGPVATPEDLKLEDLELAN